MKKRQITIEVNEEFYNVLVDLKEEYELESEKELINVMLQGAVYAVTKDRNGLFKYAKSREAIYNDILKSALYGQKQVEESRNYFMRLVKLLEE